MKAIFKREVKSYFTGMIGWVVAAVSLFFLGLYYTNRNLRLVGLCVGALHHDDDLAFPAAGHQHAQLCGGAQEPHRPAAADQSGQHPGHRGR